MHIASMCVQAIHIFRINIHFNIMLMYSDKMSENAHINMHTKKSMATLATGWRVCEPGESTVAPAASAPLSILNIASPFNTYSAPSCERGKYSDILVNT